MLLQLVRFGAVGIFGMITNLAVFAVVVKLLPLHPNLAATAAFLVAVTQNFTFNRLWTFRSAGRAPIGYGPGWTRYLVINLVGFGINLLVLNATIAWAGIANSVPGQALGILSGMGFNFVLSRLLIFRRDAGVSSR